MKVANLLIVWSFNEWYEEKMQFSLVTDDDYARKKYEGKIIQELTIPYPNQKDISKAGLAYYNQKLGDLYVEQQQVHTKIQSLMALEYIPDVDEDEVTHLESNEDFIKPIDDEYDSETEEDV